MLVSVVATSRESHGLRHVLSYWYRVAASGCLAMYTPSLTVGGEGGARGVEDVNQRFGAYYL